MLDQWFAKQLREPRGLVGRSVLPRLWNRHNVALNDRCLELLSPRSGDDVLELGFGGGYLLGRLLDVVGERGTVLGLDASLAIVAHCSYRHRTFVNSGRLKLYRLTGPRFPLDDACVDAIFSVNTVFYLDDPLTVFQELRRVLRESGSLMFCFTARESMEQKQFVAHGLTLYTPEDVSMLLKLAGFSTVDVTRHRERSRFFYCALAS